MRDMHPVVGRVGTTETGNARLATRLGRTVLPPLLYMLSALAASAQDSETPGRYWGYYGTVDHSSWDGLGDVEPVGRGGPFQTDGTGVSLGAYTSVARLGSAWLLAGGEFGFLGLNSDVIIDRGPGSAKAESAFEVNHITGSLTLRFGKPAGRYWDLGIGMGQYIGDTKYIDCGVILRCFGADTSDTATGIYLEVRGTPGLGVLIGARIHYFDFDPIEAVDLGTNALEGPIYSLFFGWEYGNWRRN
jgi:hypothetical protein